jgi:hypothetical protein
LISGVVQRPVWPSSLDATTAKVDDPEHAFEGRSGLIAMTRPLYTKPPKLTDPQQWQRSAETAAAAEQAIQPANYWLCISRASAGMRK